MTNPRWFRPRGYGHLDAPVGASWAQAITPALVRKHAWSPLIHFVKKTKRYKPTKKKTETKERDIMFASHRDSAILAKYSAELVALLDARYKSAGLQDTVIAYRSLGKSNYHFASVVQSYVRANDPICVLCFDVTGFFDNIDHKILKTRLKSLLMVTDLPEDWQKVFRFITKYRYIKRDELKLNPTFAARMRSRRRRAPIATIREIKSSGISINPNPSSHGIPQGTPISASMSNLYMLQFDSDLLEEATKRGALYQRYSDDILIACPPGVAKEIEDIVTSALKKEALEIQAAKTEICHLTGGNRFSFQYLGYQMGYIEAEIRPGSMSKQWRSAKRAIRKAEKQGLSRISQGKAEKIYTRKLRSRLTHVGMRNFMSYVRRSAEELDSTTMRKQAKRLHRFALRGIERIKRHKILTP